MMSSAMQDQLLMMRINLPAENLGDAAMRYSQLARYVTRSHALTGQIDYLIPHKVGQRPSVDKMAAQLIHSGATVT